MSSTTTESEDGMLSKDNLNSPSFDEGSFGGSSGGGTALKKGPWTSAEDAILVDYVNKHGEGNWNAVQKHSGLSRCGKSCRLRWANHLRPNLKKGAFTEEEESLIVELHAKMGNKWARMAAHLPGRTDNEIKNYWNTRIKRRQRAGLPLYPQELSMQVLHENQQTRNTNEFNNGDMQQLVHDYLDFPEIKFNNLNRNLDVMAYAPQFPDITIGNMLNQGLGSSQIYSLGSTTMHQPKRLRRQESLFPGFSSNVTDGLDYQNDTHVKTLQHFRLPYPYDPVPSGKNPPTFGMLHGSDILPNDIISTSKPLSGSFKSELPSFQYPETGLGSWETPSSPSPSLVSVDALIQSPPSSTRLTQSDCGSPRNSGLLDALLHESQALSCPKNQSSEKSSNSCVVTPGDAVDSSPLNLREMGWEESSDPISPLGCSAASHFNEHTPPSGSLLDDRPAPKISTGFEVKQEPNEFVITPDEQGRAPTQLSFPRPDTLLDGSFYEQSFEFAKDQSNLSDFLPTYIGEDIYGDYKQTPAESASSNQGWCVQSYSWDNFSPIYKMSDVP